MGEPTIPPVSSGASTDLPSPPPSAPAETEASASSIPFSPHRMEFAAGPAWLRPGRSAPNLFGYALQGRLGSSFSISPHWNWGLQGVFSYSDFSQNGDHLSRIGVGLETGPEWAIAPRIFHVALYGGVHQAFYYSRGIPWESPPGRAAFDNAHVASLSLRPALLFGGGLFTAAFEWNHDFGLQGPGRTPADLPIGYNPDLFSLLFTLDLIKAFHGLRGVETPTQGIVEFLNGIQVGGLAEANYSYSFNQPAEGSGGTPGVGTDTYRTNDPHHNRFRLNLLQLSLDRPATAESPLGFGFDFNFGQDPGTFAPRESVLEPVIGARGDPGTQYFAIRRALLRYRFPVLEGFTLEAGQFPTTVGYEVLDGPSNALLSRGLLNTLAEPYYHAGALMRMRFHERKDDQDVVQSSTEGILGVANGWDSVLGHDPGPTLITGLNTTFSPQVSLSLNYLIGDAPGGVRGLFDGILTTHPHDTVTLAANVDIGHGHHPDTGEGGMWAGLALYEEYKPVPWWQLAAREEYFIDQQGLRSGIPQDLMSLTLASTFNLPYGFGIGPEIRHDRSFRRSGGDPGPFFAGANPADSNTTFGLRAFWRYPFPY